MITQITQRPAVPPWNLPRVNCSVKSSNFHRYGEPNYLDLDCLSSAHCTDGLIGLSVRWMQPIQQQGRRFPSCNSATVLSIWFFLVSACLTVIFQQIHSLRASGVISSHAANALGLETSAFLKSVGSLCATPPEISSLDINVSYLSVSYSSKIAPRASCSQ